MSNGFYKYIVKQIVKMFQNRIDLLREGERFCLKLDTAQMVEETDKTLREYLAENSICGTYSYKNVYSTYTLKLDLGKEVVIAAKTAGMTDDFLATLRNADLTESKYPILMITDSPNDSILSGTIDLGSAGMPFHPKELSSSILSDVNSQQLSIVNQVIVESELERKAKDQYADKSSLFEYRDVLTVLDRGFVSDEDFARFLLLIDKHITSTDKEKIRDRIKQNRKHFSRIDHVVRHGNISYDLCEEYDDALLKRIADNKKEGHWYKDITLDEVLSSAEKVKQRQDNPLTIENDDIIAYYQSPIEYLFPPDELMLIRNEGETKANQRKKNIIIYNPDNKEKVSFQVQTNITLRQSYINTSNSVSFETSGKKLIFSIPAIGCSSGRIIITDPNNNIKYDLKICVVCVNAGFFDSIRTAYSIEFRNGNKKMFLSVSGIDNSLQINPEAEEILDPLLIRDGSEYSCSYKQRLVLLMDDDSIDINQGFCVISINSGAASIPIKIYDSKFKAEEITGTKAFLLKHQTKQSFEYCAGKNPRLIIGTREFFVKQSNPFTRLLWIEDKIVQGSMFAASIKNGDISKSEISLPATIQTAYMNLIAYLQKHRTLPSLVFYNEEYSRLATEYVDAYRKTIHSISTGRTLSNQDSSLLSLGCIFDESIIMLSPLHPLNVQYQLTLNTEDFTTMKETLIGKLLLRPLNHNTNFSTHTAECTLGFCGQTVSSLFQDASGACA